MHIPAEAFLKDNQGVNTQKRQESFLRTDDRFFFDETSVWLKFEVTVTQKTSLVATV